MRTRVIAAAAGLLALVPLAAVPATSASASASRPVSALVAGGSPRVVTLPTGQQVALYGPAGAPSSFGPPPGVTWPASDPVTGATMDGHLYAIPVSALPTLAGHLEDYDLTRLAGGPAAPATHARAAGRAGSRNYWTLTINPVPVSGAITFYALVQLMNVDDAAKFAITTGIGPQGESFSVPQGHYSLVAVFFGLENGQLVSRTVVDPEFTVDAPDTVTADASSATVDPSASVSQPASLTLETMTVTRTAREHGGLGILSDSPNQAFTELVNPTARVRTGSLHYDTYWHFVSPDNGASYTYDLDYPSVGSIPADQAHPAPSGSPLAAIGTHYASEVPGQSAAAGRTVIDLAGLGAVGFTQLNPITVPAERTEYVTASPGVHWQSSVVRLAGTFEDWFSDALRTYQPGSQPTETWLREPLTPGVAQFAQPWYEPLLCPACRQGDDLNLIIAPYADDSGHVAVQPTAPGGTPGDVASGSYTLSSGGTVLATGSYPDGVQIPIPHAAARYQLSYDVTRSAPWWTQSTATSTEWTFTSAPSSAKLPPGWFCTATGITRCAVLPLIFASYRLPADDTGHEPAGPVTSEIDVHHLQGAPSPSITSVTLRVSFDGGTTWQQADVTPIAPGRYQANYVNPAGASAADLWLTAADAKGNTLSQVIHQVYAITTP
jgi:hypothetical protein